jgi:hypothetical protein
MASLTPKHRSDEVTGQAMTEGLINGAVVLVPCLAGLFFAMKNPNFVKVRVSICVCARTVVRV